MKPRIMICWKEDPLDGLAPCTEELACWGLELGLEDHFHRKSSFGGEIDKTRILVALACCQRVPHFGLAPELELAGGSFDIVWAFDVLQDFALVEHSFAWCFGT